MVILLKIGYINTHNRGIAKDIIIRNLQYVEMEDEILIENDYLIRFIEKEEIDNKLNLIDIINNPYSFEDFELDEDGPALNINSNVTRLKKKDYKMESRRINNKIKTKIYNGRKY